ncbi:MAG: peptidase domain-containing ABC transporter [Bacteroidota bacterium]|nr:peptidase domain-containing ABC transporter [Bacteroidota bacterium]
MNKYKFQKQYDTIDCGPSCLKMISAFYGKNYSLEFLRESSYLTREGVSIVSIGEAAEKIGFNTFISKLTIAQLIEECPLPCILHWNQDHFVVLYDISNNYGWLPWIKKKEPRFIIADPAHGIVEIDQNTFTNCWLADDNDKGIGLLVEPTNTFYDLEPKPESRSLIFMLRYLRPFRKYIVQLIIGMVLASLFSLGFPILTQLLIDVGVAEKSLPVILLIFASQLFLFLGNVAIDMVRGWLLLHINARISLSIISDFLIKLLRLPISFFETKAVGDISQRIGDHHRIESFLTGTFLSSAFSLINMMIFMVVLAYYNIMFLLIFVVLSSLALLWVFLFQKKRKNLDYKRFSRNRENQDKLYEMITGMQEIKLFGADTSFRWKWEKLQVRYFKLNIESLNLEQFQQSGYLFFTHLKNILLSFWAVYEVINHHLTLGSLLSISYITGQINGPIEQIVGFLKSAQDAKLSMDRLQEIHNKEDEERAGGYDHSDEVLFEDILIDGMSFQYEGPSSPFVLKDINLIIPKGKVTAIVGSSGSGKTTFMKLLLNYYKPTAGEIKIGDKSHQDVSPRLWRQQCGTVMQDGYLFNDSIANNIALGAEEIDLPRLDHATRVANLYDFIQSLPLKYNTKIGASGAGLSGGQKQRILIARAVYKNPEYIFFDEATSSLDANNEKTIIDNLNNFFVGKTVIIIAHRLSTVKNADQIIMLENGMIIEKGNHKSLCDLKGEYYELVKNQLNVA